MNPVILERSRKAVVLAAAFILALNVAAARTGTVSIDSGRVEGVTEDGVVAYKGIPFAAPPVGGLRWRAPQPAAAWHGTYEATAFKPQCMQLGPPLPTMPEEPTSEDCLYLNVWRPAHAAATKRPVMVWIHGGQFRRGSPSTPLYWGDELARKHGVVVINIAYRVGALGFLAHADLTAESEHRVSGNYGILDTVAALRWVQRNAAAFGGDPNRITVFGQSAGAWVVNKLMISPLARGLFHAAIAQSGGDMGPTRTNEGMATLADAEKSGEAFMRTFGVGSIKDFRTVPADRIVASTFDGIPEIPHSNAALPIVDGYVIPGDTYSLYEAGKQANVPLLLGYNADEGAYIAPRTDTETFTQGVRRRYGPLAESLLKLLPTDARSQERLWAESTFGWQMWSWAGVHARTSSSNVFFYYYTNKQNGHGAELPYLFGHPFMRAWDDADRRTAETISGYWTTFAKTGAPNGASLPHWPTYKDQTQRVMYLGEKTTVGDMPDLSLHRLFDQYMASLRMRSPGVEHAGQ